jgi:MYXO-CTERM domain-containing protein
MGSTTTSDTRESRSYGWIGLIGLLGLLGMRRRHDDTGDMNRNRTTSTVAR